MLTNNMRINQTEMRLFRLARGSLMFINVGSSEQWIVVPRCALHYTLVSKNRLTVVMMSDQKVNAVSYTHLDVYKRQE